MAGFKEVAFKGCGLDLECAPDSWRLFEQTGSLHGMFVREGDKESDLQERRFRTQNRYLQQRDASACYVQTRTYTRGLQRASFNAEPVISSNAHNAAGHQPPTGGERTFGSFVDFSDDAFLVFELNCHGFYSLDLTIESPRATCFWVFGSQPALNREHHLA